MSLMLGISVIACGKSVDPNETVVTVQGMKVSAGQYEKMLKLYKQSIEAMYGTGVWEQEVEEGVTYKDKFKDVILGQIVETDAVYAQAEKEKLLPTDAEVDKAFKELKKSMESDTEYKKTLEEIGIDDAFLKEQQKKDLAWENYKKNFEEKTKISDEEIKKYYEDNKKSFYKDEVEASHILISTVDENDKPLSDKKKEEAKKKAEDILKKVKAGEEFSALAKEYSDDPGSASKGGDLGFFTKGQMVKPFEEAAFSMKVGEISDLVESEFGYHIIKVTDKVDEQLSLEDKKDNIKDTLLYDKYSKSIKKLAEDAKVEKNEEVIKKIKF